MLPYLHQNFVHLRRVRVLATHLADLIPSKSNVLDVGGGDGKLAAALSVLRPDLNIEAIDTTVRAHTEIPVTHYDGRRFPFDDRAFDVVMMIDVLHHVDDIDAVIAEAIRVSRHGILIKDHFVQGWFARPTLTLMDHIGNRRFGIAIPANYQTPQQWDAIYSRHRLQSVQRRDRLNLYPPPLAWFFERRLHFIHFLELKKHPDRRND